MADLVVETPEGLTLRQPLAGGGSRSASALIDVALWGLAVLSVLFLTQLVLQGAGGLGAIVGSSLILSLIGYHVLFGVFMNGQTPGKWLLGLTVVDQHGLPASPLQHVLRGLFWPVEAVILVPIPFGVLLMAATPRHQRLGDRVAGTLVVRGAARRRVGPILQGVRWSGLKRRRLALVPAHAARFDADDLHLLRELVGRTGLEPDARERLLRRAVRLYSARLEVDLGDDLPASEARAVLAELYLFLRELRAGERRAADRERDPVSPGRGDGVAGDRASAPAGARTRR